MKILMIFLLAYLYVHCVTFLPMVMHMHIKLVNSFGNWLTSTADYKWHWHWHWL